MSTVRYTTLQNNTYKYQAIGSNQLLITSNDGYQGISVNTDGENGVLISNGTDWSFSTDFATDTELANEISTLSSDINLYYATKTSLQTLSSDINLHYATKQSLDDYTSDNELNEYKQYVTNTYATQSALSTYSNSAASTYVTKTQYDNDIDQAIYTIGTYEDRGINSCILTYWNGAKQSINLPSTNGKYILNKTNTNQYSFTELEQSNLITPTYSITSGSTQLSGTNQSFMSFTNNTSGNYLIVGNLDIYINDIVLLTPPDDSTLLDYEWIDALPIIHITINNTSIVDYVIKQNQPLQTIPINTIVNLSSTGTVNVNIWCEIFSITGGPTLTADCVYIRPYKSNFKITNL